MPAAKVSLIVLFAGSDANAIGRPSLPGGTSEG